jgi:hypothetical protein
MRKITTIENVAYLKRPDFYVSIDELVEKGIPRPKVNALAKDGIVKAVYVNHVLMLSKAGMEAWAAEQDNPQPPKRRGRPPKEKGTTEGAEAQATPKRGRGRPRKDKSAMGAGSGDAAAKPKGRRGRPRKGEGAPTVVVRGGRRGRPAAGSATESASYHALLAGLVAGLTETNALIRAFVESARKEDEDRSTLSASIGLIEAIFRTIDIELTKEERALIAKAVGHDVRSKQGTEG